MCTHKIFSIINAATLTVDMYTDKCIKLHFIEFHMVQVFVSNIWSMLTVNMLKFDRYIMYYGTAIV